MQLGARLGMYIEPVPSNIAIKAERTSEGVAFANLSSLLPDGTQIFDYKLEILMKAAFKGSGSPGNNYFGAGGVTAYRNLWGIAGDNQRICYWWLGDRYRLVSGYQNAWHTFSLDKTYGYVDGRNVTSMNSASTSGGWNNFRIGVCGTNRQVGDYAIIKYAKVYNSARSVIINLIPSIVNGVGCFVDTITEQRFSSATSVPFEVVDYDGPNIT